MEGKAQSPRSPSRAPNYAHAEAAIGVQVSSGRARNANLGRTLRLGD